MWNSMSPREPPAVNLNGLFSVAVRHTFFLNSHWFRPYLVSSEKRSQLYDFLHSFTWASFWPSWVCTGKEKCLHCFCSLSLCVCVCNCACVFLAWTNCPRLCLFSLTGGQISFLLAAFMRVCSQAGQCWQHFLTRLFFIYIYILDLYSLCLQCLDFWPPYTTGNNY